MCRVREGTRREGKAREMSILQTLKPNPSFLTLFPNKKPNQNSILIYHPFFSPSTNPPPKLLRLSFSITAAASNPTQNPDPNPNLKPKSRRERRPKSERPQETGENTAENFPTTIPRKPRRGRRSEAVAVEDFVRGSLERTFTSIRQQNSGILDEKDEILKKKIEEEEDDDEESDVEGEDGVKRRKEVVEEEDADWPLDADVGWGIRASEFFEKYPIKNVVEDGMEIDWEGELDDGWVKEINCLEWESFAFHPSPLMVLVFERYKRAADNWKLLKELEKATKVYWNSKDRLPPRTVKIDINIETDLAYALKAKECPQLLFLRGNKILYREKEVRTADELVQMIAYFYYNAKKPSWIDDAALAPPY